MQVELSHKKRVALKRSRRQGRWNAESKMCAYRISKLVPRVHDMRLDLREIHTIATPTNPVKTIGKMN